MNDILNGIVSHGPWFVLGMLVPLLYFTWREIRRDRRYESLTAQRHKAFEALYDRAKGRDEDSAIKRYIDRNGTRP